MANKLDRAFQRRLENLVAEKKTEIEAGRWSPATLAKTAEQKFKRPVTEHNITGASKVMGIAFKRSRPGLNHNNSKELRAAIRLIAAELVQLKGELGQVVSPTLQLLAESNDEQTITETAEATAEAQGGATNGQAS